MSPCQLLLSDLVLTRLGVFLDCGQCSHQSGSQGVGSFGDEKGVRRCAPRSYTQICS